MSLIKVDKVTKTYKGGDDVVEALKDINLEISEGEFLALMGPSGSGKSTLLSILGGLNPPTSGKLMIDDIDVYALTSERLADFRHEYAGFVFQQYQLIPYLTALENVMLPLAWSFSSYGFLRRKIYGFNRHCTSKPAPPYSHYPYSARSNRSKHLYFNRDCLYCFSS